MFRTAEVTELVQEVGPRSRDKFSPRWRGSQGGSQGRSRVLPRAPDRVLDGVEDSGGEDSIAFYRI